MKRLLPYLLILPLLTGCSALSALLPSFGDGPSVNANAQVGKENTQQIVGSQTEADGEAQVADQANRVEGTQIINEDVPMWLWGIVILLAGWAIPTPMDMALGVVNFFRIILGKEPLKR
jgi:hypothetical protein